MKSRFRLYRRSRGPYYLHDAETGKQESLRTCVKREALEIVMARNAAVRQPLLNRTMARAYLSAQDPQMLSRTWTAVFAEFSTHGRDSSRERTVRAAASKDFDVIRNTPILETTADDFLAVLNAGGTATNNYLRRFHNLALDLGWLLAPVLPKRAWPAIRPKRKPRALTRQEYDTIIEAEGNEERRRYYQFLWETGAAQTDAAIILASSIDWDNMVLVYERKKLQEDAAPCRLRIGGALETLMRKLPTSGPLFPKISKENPRHRSSEFWRRCQLLKIEGVSLHSFRYAWAERACSAGYPERFAQAALGHSSKAVHRAYARGAKVFCPPLEDYEHRDEKIVRFQPPLPSSDTAISGP